LAGVLTRHTNPSGEDDQPKFISPVTGVSSFHYYSFSRFRQPACERLPTKKILSSAWLSEETKKIFFFACAGHLVKNHFPSLPFACDS